jgi:hypothetical protein
MGKNGQLALAADGKTLLHSPESSTVSYYSANWGSSWTAVTGLSVSNARPVADSINKNKFYALNGSSMMVSTNGGTSFAAAGSLASANGSKVIRVAPEKEGDIWVALYAGGLVRSTNSGTSFSAISGVTYGGAVGFGKAVAGASYPTVYIWGTVSGVLGVYRSTDTGATWVRVNDDSHEYGGPGNGQFVMGDMNTFGVVYMSTAGRGIAFGKPASSGISSSSSSSSSSLSSSSSSNLQSSSSNSLSAASLSSSSTSSSLNSSSLSSSPSSSSFSNSSSSAPIGGGSAGGGGGSGGGGGAISWMSLLALTSMLVMAQRTSSTKRR